MSDESHLHSSILLDKCASHILTSFLQTFRSSTVHIVWCSLMLKFLTIDNIPGPECLTKKFSSGNVSP